MSIGFNNFYTVIGPLLNTGLVQGLLLSPILFTFFNTNLVKQPVNIYRGASAFINDYF